MSDENKPDTEDGSSGNPWDNCRPDQHDEAGCGEGFPGATITPDNIWE